MAAAISEVKYSSASVEEGSSGKGWKKSAPPSAAGVERRLRISSFSRLRTNVQSPRFSVAAQSSVTIRLLSLPMSAAAARKKRSASGRDSSGITSRNWPPPLVPSSIRDNPSSASRARGSTSASRATHLDLPIKSRSSVFSPSATWRLDERNCSIPKTLPCRKT